MIRNQTNKILQSFLVWSIGFTNLAWDATHRVFGQDQNSLRHQVEAVAGTPYGVARILLPAGQIAPSASLRIVVSDTDQRVTFPAFDVITSEAPPVSEGNPADRPSPGRGALIKRIRTAIQNAREQIDPPELIRIQFLFRGDTPFKVQIHGDFTSEIEIRPSIEANPQRSAPTASVASIGALAKPLDTYSPRYRSLLGSWWEGYVAHAKLQLEKSDYPSIVEMYLTHLNAYRYGFPLPELTKPKQKQAKQSDPLPTLALVAGVEGLRAEILQESLRNFPPETHRMVAVPDPPRWQDLPAPETPPELAIEAIAMQVPPECYYLRFGSFSNYLWFQDLSSTRGGDLAQMAVLRGFNYETSRRMERLLNTKTTVVAKMFGDSIIGDMAIVGQDLYLQEGPSLGVLFEAKNATLLKTSLQQDRATAAKQLASQGCTLTSMEIDGTSVSLLSTPDNEVRSFMVDKGNYVFLTTSKLLVQRFLQVQAGSPSLGASRSFRFARLMMPNEHRYDVFAYLSSEFLRNLVSPKYQIELRRRLKAIAAIEVAEMASLTRKAETGIADQQVAIDRLIEEQYLPLSFQSRADGSQTLAYGDRWHDSLRGKRGSFLPIADVTISECTAEEANDYRDQASFYASQWQQTDPIMFGLRRYSRESSDKVERLALEAYIAPLGREKYGWLSNMLAPPVRTAIQLPPDDVINAQVHLAGQSSVRSYSPDHVMFAGLKDAVPPVPGETKGLISTLRTLQSLPAYLGAWPRPGYLDRLPLGLGGGPPDALGFSKLILVGLWRWQAAGFSVLSFDRSILENCSMHLKPIPAKDMAQGRVKIGDLDRSKLSAWFNTFWFRRAAQTTRGNLMLLDSINEQLKVPAGDALKVAEGLIDAKLQCPLGGRYELNQEGARSGHPLWQSTAWPNKIETTASDRSQIGVDITKAIPSRAYKAPWLQWFRGAELHLTQLPERLVFVGTIDIEPLTPRPDDPSSNKEATVAPLPKMELDLFNLPFKFFQGDKPKQDGVEEKKPSEKRSF
jgi:hypothetical protein